MNISAKDIHLSYGAREILKGVDIHSENGEFVGLIGPNGSGKSTLLKCIYRILKPNAGQVFLDEEELRAMSIKESARKMGVVAQHNYYNFEFTRKRSGDDGPGSSQKSPGERSRQRL